MRREVLEGTLVLLLVMVGCARQVETEDPNAPYKQSLLSQAAADELVENRWLVPYQVAVGKGLDAVTDQPSVAFSEESGARDFSGLGSL